MSRTSSAFTLLEVMGAVVILGLLGTSLITSTMDSTYRAGQARDQLIASLLADDVLAELETRAADGGVAPGMEETDRDGFHITVTTAAADVSQLLAGRGDGDRDLAPATLLEPKRGSRPALLELRVEITGPGGLVTERTSFAFDPGASPELQDLAPVEDEEAPQ